MLVKQPDSERYRLLASDAFAAAERLHAPESQQVMRKLAMSYHELALLAEEWERQPKAMDAPDPELARAIQSAHPSRYRF